MVVVKSSLSNRNKKETGIKTFIRPLFIVIYRSWNLEDGIYHSTDSSADEDQEDGTQLSSFEPIEGKEEQENADGELHRVVGGITKVGAIHQ